MSELSAPVPSPGDSEHVQPTDDLVGVVMIHTTSGSVVTVTERKSDDSGWWLRGGGGLCDEVIADGSWRPLRVVLAAARAALHGSPAPIVGVADDE